MREKLEELNLRPFKKPRTGCRLSAHEQEKRAFMQPLPTHAYASSVWLSPKVGCDYLVSDGLTSTQFPMI